MRYLWGPQPWSLATERPLRRRLDHSAWKNRTSTRVPPWFERSESSLCRLGHHPVDEGGRHVELPLRPAAQFRGWTVRRRLIILAAVALLLHRPGDVLARSQSFAQEWVAKLKDFFFGVLAQTI